MRNSAYTVQAILFLVIATVWGIQPPKQYPADMRLVDITQDPYNAPNDGSADVSDIILRVFADKKHDWTRPLALYFPAGIYLVGKQIRYGTCCTHILGQGTAHTVIQLADGADLFDDPSNPRGVLRTTNAESNTTTNNVAFRNYIQDLTVDVGSNNPGAIGIEFIASNSGAVKNVVIRTASSGYCGLAMEIGWPGPLLVKNLRVEGFDYGIRVGYLEYSQTYENITLHNQKSAAIYNSGNMMAIRNLRTSTGAPAVINEKKNAMVILLDGELSGGTAGTTAIENSGFVYARNVTVDGYANVIKTGTNSISGPYVAEYFSHGHYSLFDDGKAMLHLPVKETPEFHDNTLENWVRANDFSTVAAMEQAMSDPSKTTLYWNSWSVTRTGTLRIPANIRRVYSIDALINVVNGYSGDPLVIRVEDESDHPLILEGLTVGKVILEQRCSRPVAIVHCKGPEIPQNFQESGPLYIEDALVTPHFQYPQNLWARQLNAETGNQDGVPQDMMFNPGGNWWILGLKTEGRGTIVTNTGGGALEVLGTFVYPVRSDAQLPEPKSAFINTESSLSMMYKYYRGYTYQVIDTREGKIRRLASDDATPLFTYTSILPHVIRVLPGSRNQPTPAKGKGVTLQHLSGSSAATFMLSLPVAAKVSLTLSDCVGRTVACNPLATWSPGTHTLSIPSERLAPGVVLARVRTGAVTRNVRIIVP